MKYKKCTKCGKCCAEEVCDIGIEIFGADTPCKGLVKENGKWLCAIILYSGKVHYFLPVFFSWALGIGKGCDNEEYVGVLAKRKGGD